MTLCMLKVLSMTELCRVVIGWWSYILIRKSIDRTITNFDLFPFVGFNSLRCNPLARSPGQVIRPSDKRNFIGTSPNWQVNFLLLDLFLYDHQNVFSKEFNFIMTIFHVRGLFL